MYPDFSKCYHCNRWLFLYNQINKVRTSIIKRALHGSGASLKASCSKSMHFLKKNIHISNVINTFLSIPPSVKHRLVDEVNQRLIFIFGWTNPLNLFSILIFVVIDQCSNQLIFLWKLKYIFQDYLMNRKFKRTAFIGNRNLLLIYFLSLFINFVHPCWIKD